MASKYPTYKEMKAQRLLIPKKIPFTTGQIILEVLTLLTIISSTLLLLLLWSKIPDRVPTHFGFNGQADHWGAKSSLLAFQAGAIGLYLMLTIVEFFPRSWNTSVQITAENVLPIYQRTRTLLIAFKITIALLFTYINALSALAKPLGPWFMVVLLLGLGGITVYFLWDINRIAKKH